MNDFPMGGNADKIWWMDRANCCTKNYLPPLFWTNIFVFPLPSAYPLKMYSASLGGKTHKYVLKTKKKIFQHNTSSKPLGVWRNGSYQYFGVVSTRPLASDSPWSPQYRNLRKKSFYHTAKPRYAESMPFSFYTVTELCVQLLVTYRLWVMLRNSKPSHVSKISRLRASGLRNTKCYGLAVSHRSRSLLIRSTKPEIWGTSKLSNQRQTRSRRSKTHSEIAAN